MKKPFLILTCEHAGREIPAAARDCFLSWEAQAALESHEGYDPGAREIFEHLADLATFSLAGDFSRLVVELNRSRHHPKLFSRFTKSLPESIRRDLLDKIHQPFRDRVREAVSQYQTVLHLSVHTFAPALHGETRNCDLALLYNPSRLSEVSFCDRFATALRGTPFRFRRNYPYRGSADGHTTALRKNFSDSHYTGIELEVNQRWFLSPRPETASLLESLHQIFQSHVRLPRKHG